MKSNSTNLVRNEGNWNRFAPFLPLLGVLLFVLAGARQDNTNLGAGVVVKAAVTNVDAPKARFASKTPEYTNWCVEWFKDAYAGGYQRAGKKDPKWDESALKALESHAYQEVFRKPPPGKTPEDFGKQLKDAVAAGCNDPYVRYLALRHEKPAASATRETAAEYQRLANETMVSGYPGLVKFYTSLRAAQAWRAASAQQAPEVNQYRHLAIFNLLAVLRHEDIPAAAAAEAVFGMAETLAPNDGLRDSFYADVAPALFTRWPGEGFPWTYKGNQLVEAAWEARGREFASQVTEDAWKIFKERLAAAEEALNRAWELDPAVPQTPLACMRLELGQGRGRPRMELWFQRALAFPQDQATAVSSKLYYLEPRWYGSERICLAYGREVVGSDKFTGKTPLALYHTHESLAGYFNDSRPNYWTEPQVWPDVKASFERFFKLNGDDNTVREQYIKAAVRCEQWQTVTEQIGKLTKVDYDFFGGQAAFENMKQHAGEMATKPK